MVSEPGFTKEYFEQDLHDIKGFQIIPNLQKLRSVLGVRILLPSSVPVLDTSRHAVYSYHSHTNTIQGRGYDPSQP